MVNFFLRFIFVLFLISSCTPSQSRANLYTSQQYKDTPLPQFSEFKDQLPRPIFESNPAYIDFYYKAWEIGFAHFKKPKPGSPLVANFIDEAFNDNIFCGI